MFYSLIRLSIYKPFIIIAFMGLLTIFCGWKLFQTSLDIFPEFSPKLVIIQTEAPGLSTEQVENMVTRPLESYLAGIPNIDYMRSESIAGLSVLTLTDIFLFVLTFLSGNDKHPSGNINSFSDFSIISGLINTRGSLTLITQTLLLIPI